MAKKKKTNPISGTIEKYFYFKNQTEFAIFLVWSLLVSAVLTTFMK